MSPEDLGGFNSFAGYQVGHVHDAYVLDHIAYLNCGPDGFVLVDMTDINELNLLASLGPDEYPDSGYNHSGWLSEQGDVYYMADENHGLAMKAIDVEDLTDVETRTLFGVGTELPDAIAHNLIVDGDFLFVSYYYDGLQMYDITDRENPVRVLQYPTSQLENNLQYRGAWGVYPFLPSGNVLVTDMQEGLFVIDREQDFTNNFNLSEESFSVFPNPATDLLQINVKPDGVYTFRIIDMTGKTHLKGKIQQKVGSVYTSELPSGSYIIELSNGQQLTSQLFSIIK